MTTLGSKLSALRRARGLSQEQLAEAIGVSRQAVSKWELDAAAPEIDKIKSLADFYGVTTDYLLRTDAEAPPAPTQPSNSRQSSPIPSLGVSLTGCAVGLLLQYHGRFISASEWPSLVGVILQIVCFACGLTCFVQLRHTSPTVGERFLRLFLRLSVGWSCRCRVWPACDCWFRFTRGRIGHWFRLPPDLFCTCCFAAW